MDGVEIHNPYRLFGLTSAFNPETIAAFELSTGAFAARYGDRLSSLLVVREPRRRRRAETSRGSSSLSITDANVVARGPAAREERGSWLVTGRRTYYDLVAERIVDTDLPAFSDVQARRLGAAARASGSPLFGLRSRESADACFEGDRAGEHGDFVTAARNDLARAALRPAARRARQLAHVARPGTANTDAWTSTPGSATRRAARTRPATDIGLRPTPTSPSPATSPCATSRCAQDSRSAGRPPPVRGRLRGARPRAPRVALAHRRRPQPDRGQRLQRAGRRRPARAPRLERSTRLRAGAWLQDRFQATRGLTLEPGLRLDWQRRERARRRCRRGWRDARASTTRTRLCAGRRPFTQSPGYEKLIQSDYFLDLSGADRRDLDNERAGTRCSGSSATSRRGPRARRGLLQELRRLIVGRLETEAERLARVARLRLPRRARRRASRPSRRSRAPENGASGRAYGFDVYLSRARGPGARLTRLGLLHLRTREREAYGRTFPFEYDRPPRLLRVAAWRV